MPTKLKHLHPQNDYVIVLNPCDLGTKEQVKELFDTIPENEADYTDDHWHLIAQFREAAFAGGRVPNVEVALDQLETGARFGNRHCAAVLGSAILFLYSRRQVVSDGLSWLSRAANEGVAGACQSLAHWYIRRWLETDLWDYEDVDLGLDSCYVATEASPLVLFPKDESECRNMAWMWMLRGIIEGDEYCQTMFRKFPVSPDLLQLDPELLDRAAATGLEEARISAAQYHFRGDAPSEERRKAVEEFRKLAEEGFAGGAYLLASALESDSNLCPEAAPDEAITWYLVAAEKGSPLAMRALATHFETGTLVPKDDVKAAEWYRRGAEARDGDCRLWVGKSLLDSAKTPKERREAVNWIRLAAEENDIAAAWAELADHFETGDGLYKSKKQARECRKRAAL